MYGRNLAIFLEFWFNHWWLLKISKSIWSLPLLIFFKKIFLAIDSQPKKSSKLLPSFLSLLSVSFLLLSSFNALLSLSCALLRSGVLLLLCEAQQRFLYCSLLLYHFLAWRVTQRKGRRKKEKIVVVVGRRSREREKLLCVGRRGEQHYDGGGEK